MLENQLLVVDHVPDSLLANLESRDVALWVRELPVDIGDLKALVAFLGLPWRLIVLETYDARLIEALERAADFQDPMTRKRGYIEIIAGDPSRIELPPRCLPLYLLNGRDDEPNASDFESRLRRLTMLEAVRRSAPRQFVVMSDSEAVPPDLGDLWLSGFRSGLSFVSDGPERRDELGAWLTEHSGGRNADLLRISASKFADRRFDGAGE